MGRFVKLYSPQTFIAQINLALIMSYVSVYDWIFENQPLHCNKYRNSLLFACESYTHPLFRDTKQLTVYG